MNPPADPGMATVESRPGPAAGAAWAGSTTRAEPSYAPTVANLLRHAVANHPDNLAVATPDRQLTYGELDQRSARLAAHLVSLGVGKGSRVATLVPNSAEWIVAWAAITRIGAISTPVNTFSKTPELATMLRHADVQVLIATPTFAPHDYVASLLAIAPGLASADASTPLLLPELPQLRHIIFWEDTDVAWATGGLDAILATAPPEAVSEVVSAIEDDVTPADPMLITYTSGSTGEPKGIIHGHGPLLRHAHNLAAMSGTGPDDRIWTPMPLCWIGGFSFTLLRVLVVGGAFVTQPRNDAGQALELMERHRVTCVSAWPTIGETLASHPAFATTDLSSIRLGSFYEGRAPQNRPADPGLRVTSLGMSESGGPHTFWTAEEDLHGTDEAHRGTFGHEVPGVSHRIVDDEGNDVEEGVTGEILLRGYSMMLGMHKRERADVFDADGWYHTSDRGYFRDGWFFYTGRRSDLIKTKGANVAAAEVEAAIVSHAGIDGAFVFGIEHPVHGEEVVALVVGPIEAIDGLGQTLRDQLSSYKIPRYFFPIEAAAVPYMTSQKPDRRKLAQTARDLTLAARPA